MEAGAMQQGEPTMVTGHYEAAEVSEALAQFLSVAQDAAGLSDETLAKIAGVDVLALRAHKSGHPVLTRLELTWVSFALGAYIAERRDWLRAGRAAAG
jgi:hypothetical protein